MNKISFFAAVALGLMTVSTRAITIVTSSTQPATTGTDIVNFNNSGTLSGSHDYTNNQPYPGQTFMTLGSPGGYTLSGIIVQGFGGGGGYQASNFFLTLYSVSGGTMAGSILTPLTTQTFNFADKSGSTDYSGKYLTFNLAAPIAVAANSLYAFSLVNQGSAQYYGLDVSSGNSYSGGSSIGVTPPTGYNSALPTTIGATYTNDRSFAVELSTVPEPSTWVLMLGGLATLAVMPRFLRRWV